MLCVKTHAELMIITTPTIVSEPPSTCHKDLTPRGVMEVCWSCFPRVPTLNNIESTWYSAICRIFHQREQWAL